jgi:hypothetical protein
MSLLAKGVVTRMLQLERKCPLSFQDLPKYLNVDHMLKSYNWQGLRWVEEELDTAYLN